MGAALASVSPQSPELLAAQGEEAASKDRFLGVMWQSLEAAQQVQGKSELSQLVTAARPELESLGPWML